MIKDRLKLLRTSHDCTKKQVSIFLNMSPEGYGYYENGTRSPSPETILKLADYFDVTTDYLLGRTDEPGPPTGAAKPGLPEDEERLLGYYRELNEQGKEYVSQTAHLASQVYKKDSDIPCVEVEKIAG